MKHLLADYLGQLRLRKHHEDTVVFIDWAGVYYDGVVLCLLVCLLYLVVEELGAVFDRLNKEMITFYLLTISSLSMFT